MDELVDTTQTSEVWETSEVLNGFKEIKIGPHLSPGGYAATPSPLPTSGEGRGPGGGERAFKETELGPIPVEWEVVRLGDVVGDSFSGGTPSTKRPEYWNGNIPWTTSAVIGDNDAILSRFQRAITELGLERSASKIAPKGSLIVGTRVGVGKAVVSEFDIAMSQDLTALVLKSHADALFLAYLFKSAPLQRQIQGRTRGTTIKGMPRKDLLTLIIPLPPLPEQRRIAHVLSTIQRAIAAQDKLIAAAREVKRSLMRHLFTYGPGAKPTLTKETEFGQVPEHWRIMPLKACAYVQTGAAKGRKLGQSQTITVPYLRVANVQDGYLDLSQIKKIRIRASELERYSLQPGDVVLTEGGDFDKLGRGFIWRGQIPNCIHQNHIFAVRTNREILLPEYLAYLVQSDYGKSYFLTVAHRTTHLACINSTKLKAFPTLVPHLGEQERIAGLLSVADRKIHSEEQRKAALQALFKSMLHQLMTGQVRLRNVEFNRITQ